MAKDPDTSNLFLIRPESDYQFRDGFSAQFNLPLYGGFDLWFEYLEIFFFIFLLLNFIPKATGPDF